MIFKVSNVIKDYSHNENVFTYSNNNCFEQYNFVTEAVIIKVSIDVDKGIKMLQNYYLVVKIRQGIAKIQSFFQKRFQKFKVSESFCMILYIYKINTKLVIFVRASSIIVFIMIISFLNLNFISSLKLYILSIC